MVRKGEIIESFFIFFYIMFSETGTSLFHKLTNVIQCTHKIAVGGQL